MKISLNIPGQRRRIGEILIEEAIISEDDLRAALAEQRIKSGKMRLGTLLMERGLITAHQFMRALSQQLTIVRRYGEPDTAVKQS